MDYGKVIMNVQEQMGQLLKAEMAEFRAQLASVNDASGKVGDLDPSIKLFEQSFTNFTSKVFSLLQMIVETSEKTEERLSELEQYSRRNCILIHGVEEGNQEENLIPTVLKIFNEKLDLDIKKHQIDRTHRIGAKRTMAEITKKGHRAIVVKFVSYEQRSEVFNNKRKLKGSNLVISESLTRQRLDLLKCAKEKFDKNNVWTHDGKIVVLENEKVLHYL